MDKLDLKKQYKDLYAPSVKEVQIVDVPEFTFAAVGGRLTPGEMPGDSQEFADAIGALYGMAYGLKFMSKQRKDSPIDYTVMALEGLWPAPEGFEIFGPGAISEWTLMIMQPDHITAEMFEEALAQLRKKKDNPSLDGVRLWRHREGLSVQTMHVGPYSEEMATLEKLLAFAEEQGYKLVGPHHEIYLGDPRRAQPEKLKTVLRYPVVAV